VDETRPTLVPSASGQDSLGPQTHESTETGAMGQGGLAPPVEVEVELDDPQLSLLERLDHRQNRVLTELDRLNEAIERLVAQCQHDRQRPPLAA
jgi:hypothetical protein